MLPIYLSEVGTFWGHPQNQHIYEEKDGCLELRHVEVHDVGFCEILFWCRSLPPEKLEVMPLYPSKMLETKRDAL